MSTEKRFTGTSLDTRIQAMGYQLPSRDLFTNIAMAIDSYIPDLENKNSFDLQDELGEYEHNILNLDQPIPEEAYFTLAIQTLKTAHVSQEAIAYALSTSFPIFVAMHRDHSHRSFGGITASFVDNLIQHRNKALDFAISETEAAVSFVEQRSIILQKVLAVCTEGLQKEKQGVIKAMALTGSVPRGDAYLYSDLDVFFFTDLDMSLEENQKRVFNTSTSLSKQLTTSVRKFWKQFDDVSVIAQAPLDQEAGKKIIEESLWDESLRSKTFVYSVTGIDEKSIQAADGIMQALT